MRASLGQRLNDALAALMALEHRVDPLFRDGFDALLQRPLAEGVQFLIRRVHPSRETRLCEEVPVENEAELTAGITRQMALFLEREYRGTIAERAGNTKTYGVVRGVLRILEDLPGPLRKGIFATPERFPAWIRFGGPGPRSPPDVEDAGILSIGVKVMGVPGPKLLDDEQHTQDFLGISCPTFTTPDVAENIKLQRAVWAGTPVLYFLDPPHLLDALMQGLYSRMNTNPLEVRYWSCVPFLHGEAQAAKYSIRPCSGHRTKIPWNPPDDWLRQAMASTLSRSDVELDFLVQLQTDPARMPIENAGVEWPERLSPFVPVAKLEIPRQEFDSPGQRAFARRLSYNPWHAIAAHRPLGNLNRARRVIYSELSRLRQAMNQEPHVEPDGSEVFSDRA